MPRPVVPAAGRAGLNLFELATEVRMDATRHLTALAGDASMCAIGRSGRSFPAAKYHEGRQAAAGQARRLLRDGGAGIAGSPASAGSAGPSPGENSAESLAPAPHDAGADDSVAQALAGVTSHWQQMLADAEAKGPDWVAYATGGLDALAEISEQPR
jgi:hypothetical protein